MASSKGNNCWIRRHQCPCGDNQCHLKVEMDEGDTSKALQTPSEADDTNVLPYVGQSFLSDDEAYEFYSNFARESGFTIRRHRTLGSQGHPLGIYRREFVCHRAGPALPWKSTEIVLQRDRKPPRCKCEAGMVVAKDIISGIPRWNVLQFSNVHNHELLENDEVRNLPTYHNIPVADRDRILVLSKAGCPLSLIMRVLELEKSVEPGHLLFTEKDVRNFIQSSKNIRRDNDPWQLLKACKRMKDRDTDFTYDFTLDENQRVENIAWSYGESIHAYKTFCDAVVFDTTYCLKAYHMPLGLWVGVDNYGKTFPLGCALLRDERSHSYSWALKTFVGFMNGIYPQTILTNQDLELRDAISSELPNTKHAFYIWDIMSKLSSWFSHLLGSQYDAFESEFQRLYNLGSVKEFEHQWQQMAIRFELSLNRHVAFLFSHRALWALPYLQDHFFAGTETIEQSKSINMFLQELLTVQTHLKDLVTQVGIIVDSRNQERKDATMQQRSLRINLKTSMPVEEHASTILTHYAFKMLQNEIVLSLQNMALKTANGSYSVMHMKTDGEHAVVNWQPSDQVVHCTCKKFEFSGILCRHAIRVLHVKNNFSLPERYLPSRWRCYSSSVKKKNQNVDGSDNDHFQSLHSLATTLCQESSMTEDCVEYVREQMMSLLNHVRGMQSNGDAASNLVAGPPIVPRAEGVSNGSEHSSVGNPQPENEGAEIVKKPRHCHWLNCRQTGHDSRNCPLKRIHILPESPSNDRSFLGEIIQPISKREPEGACFGGVEPAIKPRYCQVPSCGQTGHDSRNCPLKKILLSSHPNIQLEGKILEEGNRIAKKPRYCHVPSCGGTGHDSRNCPLKKKT
ncbi:putative protein FAR1-RELATED SEQUENCE 10 isoform X2 [Magnolia sinica]|uniref:putative protein FAR1-RELATED SEQUENCE 10 isoform X2 n=1 Tax=Magnolia sinica TaxID=86752 RepID=UPI002659C951|nr:putative protein FAR1-RELATED SEQUENCE 10 isoform X2 [Magnolia sinica]